MRLYIYTSIYLQVLANVRMKGQISLDSIFQVITAGMIAMSGLAMDDPVIVVASMFIAPLMVISYLNYYFLFYFPALLLSRFSTDFDKLLIILLLVHFIPQIGHRGN